MKTSAIDTDLAMLVKEVGDRHPVTTNIGDWLCLLVTERRHNMIGSLKISHTNLIIMMNTFARGINFKYWI